MHKYGKYFSLTLLNIKFYRSRWPLLPTEIICVLFEVVTTCAPTESGLPGRHAVPAVFGLLDPDEEGTTIPPKEGSHLPVDTGNIPDDLKNLQFRLVSFCMFPSGLFTCVCNLSADVSEHSVCSIFIGE
jgi:hypothetical protein